MARKEAGSRRPKLKAGKVPSEGGTMGLRTLLASTLLAVLLPLGASAEPDLVLVDPSLGFATVYVSMPADLSADARAELAKFLARHEGAYLEPWHSFVRDVRKHVAAQIRKNDYPEVDFAESLVMLLRNFELEEIGLTWNGGLALTDDAYDFAEKTYEAYRRDGSFEARPWNRGRDPVHPWNQTVPLLNARPTAGWPC
jgi:hypothetical protein